MSRRDMMWRGAGALLMGASCFAAQTGVGRGPAAITCFAAAIAGIVLMVNGHHVLTVLRAERRGHGSTAASVHAARINRRSGRRDEGRS